MSPALCPKLPARTHRNPLLGMGVGLAPQQWGKGAIAALPHPHAQPCVAEWGLFFPQAPQSLFKQKPKTAVLLLEGNISIGARAVTHNGGLQDLPLCAV